MNPPQTQPNNNNDAAGVPSAPAPQRAVAHSASMAGATKRLLLIGLIAIAVLPPLATAVSALLLERHEARATAGAIAGSIVWTRTRDGVDADPAALRSLLAMGSADVQQWREALGPDGAVLAAAGDERAQGSLVVSATVPINMPGSVSAVRVLEPLNDVFDATAIAALLSIAAAALVWTRVVRRSLGALHKAEGRLRSITLIDPLTGLLNRAGLRQRLQRGLDAEAGAASRRVGVLLIDLDRFRLINESLGQQAGDQLLRAVAARIRGVLRQGDALARLGGDQFVVFTPTLAGEQAAAVMARNLLRAVEPMLVIGQRQTPVSVSIGIALAGADAHAADALLAHADAAMRAAKSGGGGRYRVFEASMLVDTQQQLELDMALRRALANDEFVLAFQPIMSADGLGIHAVEALLRWNHPVRGLVSPAEFIPVLEQTGLIVAVGDWVLREACRRMRGWNMHGALPVLLSVNVSPLQFAEPGYVGQVLAALQATGLPARQLQLEVTEGLLLDPTPEALRKMDALVDAGVRLAVDDFGMGYSSLAYLKRFRLHSLKIDRLFVRDVPRLAQDSAIVRAIVELAHALELHVTAEGVETAEQHRALRAIGCDSMQGFLFARPMPADAMRARLAAEDDGYSTSEHAPSDWSTTMAAQLDMGLPTV